MRNFVIIGFLLITLFACKKEMKAPEDLIPRDEMVAILKDIYVHKQIRNYRITDDLVDEPKANLKIFEKHKVSLDQFQRSYQFYVIDNAAYDVILEEVKTEIKKELPPEALEQKKDDK